ncbi:MAG: nicotinate phosphoribosyltransferase [Solirubrobacterales bacterium]
MPRPPHLDNLILNVDNYKHTHYAQYPEGTEYVSSYIESRGGRFPATQFVGLQAFLLDFLTRPITLEDVAVAEYVTREQGVHFNRDNWLGIINDHDGYLPVEIEAVPEGTVVPTKNVLVQLVNTDPKYYWVTSFFETALLRSVWYPTSVGTLSWSSKQVIRRALEQTSDHPEMIRLYLHDYGARGVSSQESAALGGMAHLVNFSQSDTVPGNLAAQYYYNAVAPAHSCVNMEHASTSMWGRDGEAEALRNAIDYFGAEGIVGLLCDTFDHENNIRNIVGGTLKEQIASFPGLIGARADSGDPVEVTIETVEMLMEAFGSETNSKGYRVLPPNLRVVQGDGLNLESHRQIYIELARRGLAADNVLCGMGGGLLQQINRDTLNFGQKANAACINGEWIDVKKTPTGDTMKHSKAGRLALRYVDGDYETVPRDSIPEDENVMVPVFRNGKLLKRWDFTDLIANSEREVPEYYYQDVVAPMADMQPVG